jgi:hypothetical protein
MYITLVTLYWYTVEPLSSGLRLTVNSINRATLLRAVLEEDCDLREFYKKWTIKDAIFHVPIVGMTVIVWLCGSPGENCIQMWWGDDLNGNEPEPQRDVRTTKGKNSYLYSFLK